VYGLLRLPWRIWFSAADSQRSPYGSEKRTTGNRRWETSAADKARRAKLEALRAPGHGLLMVPTSAAMTSSPRTRDRSIPEYGSCRARIGSADPWTRRWNQRHERTHEGLSRQRHRPSRGPPRAEEKGSLSRGGRGLSPATLRPFRVRSQSRSHASPKFRLVLPPFDEVEALLQQSHGSPGASRSSRAATHESIDALHSRYNR